MPGSTQEILSSFDGRDWANAFNEVLASRGNQPLDPEWLTGWFANALMRGYDEGVKSMVTPPPTSLKFADSSLKEEK